jgi:hypothetical protein
MAVYTPSALATAVALTASGGTQIVAAASTNILRTIHFSTSGSGKTVTFSIGADAAGTRIFDAMALTQAVPSIFNGWWVTTLRCDGNVNSTTAQIYVGGYTYA